VFLQDLPLIHPAWIIPSSEVSFIKSIGAAHNFQFQRSFAPQFALMQIRSVLFFINGDNPARQVGSSVVCIA
jgi:hypothetical protein